MIRFPVKVGLFVFPMRSNPLLDGRGGQVNIGNDVIFKLLVGTRFRRVIIS